MSAPGFAGMKCWLEAGLGFLYPEVCQHCGNERATAGQGFIGPRCRELVQYIEPPFCERCGLPYEGAITAPFECSNCREMDLHFAQARSAAAARGVVLDVIHRYKYQRALWFEPFLADLLVERAAAPLRAENWDLIVPVPLHPQKHAEREFNQAERLARRLSAATHIPVGVRCLRRVLSTRTQTQLTRTQRAANVRHAFALGEGTLPAGRRIVLVDDVLTTGATTSACARVLMDAQAEKVCVWTVARGLFH
jgi:competence protein ComFC